MTNGEQQAAVFVRSLATYLDDSDPLKHHVEVVCTMAEQYAFLRDAPVYDTALAVVHLPAPRDDIRLLQGSLLDDAVTKAMREYALNRQHDAKAP